jgi:hypothetical protein
MLPVLGQLSAYRSVNVPRLTEAEAANLTRLDRPDRPQRAHTVTHLLQQENSACDKYCATSTVAVVRAEAG